VGRQKKDNQLLTTGVGGVGESSRDNRENGDRLNPRGVKVCDTDAPQIPASITELDVNPLLLPSIPINEKRDLPDHPAKALI
jgi:hypothetical protein